MTSQEDDLAGRGPYRKTTSLERHLTGRGFHRKTNLKEDNLARRRPYRKTVKGKSVGSVARVSQSGSELGPAQAQHVSSNLLKHLKLVVYLHLDKAVRIMTRVMCLSNNVIEESMPRVM